jgi:hypothetical protein
VRPYVVVPSDDQVEVWSGYQLQFKGMRRHSWQDALAHELRGALGRLPIPAGTALSGVYMTTDPALCDVQNRLFTNPLDAMPRGVLGVRFERGLGSLPERPEPIELVGGYTHYYRYRTNSAWESWQVAGVVVRWERARRRMSDDGSARPTWLAIRQAAAESRLVFSGVELGPRAFFGVRIIVHATARGPSNAIESSERIVDGAIAAFHADAVSAHVLEALTLKLMPTDTSDVANALAQPAGPLFTTPAIRVAGKSIQISPADERCQVGEVVIHPRDAHGAVPELSGELFTLHRMKA